MYGVNPQAYGAQAYYNSLFDLYASWGVDYVKVDDICTTAYHPTDPYAGKGEIQLIRHAIDQCWPSHGAESFSWPSAARASRSSMCPCEYVAYDR